MAFPFDMIRYPTIVGIRNMIRPELAATFPSGVVSAPLAIITITKSAEGAQMINPMPQTKQPMLLLVFTVSLFALGLPPFQ